MKWLMGFIGGTLASLVGWWVGALFGMVTAYILSTIAYGFGMYYAVKWAKNNFG